MYKELFCSSKLNTVLKGCHHSALWLGLTKPYTVSVLNQVQLSIFWNIPTDDYNWKTSAGYEIIIKKTLDNHTIYQYLYNELQNDSQFDWKEQYTLKCHFSPIMIFLLL